MLSELGNGWELINGKCRPVRCTLSALPEFLINEKEQCDNNGDTSCDDECKTDSDCGVLSSSDESDEELPNLFSINIVDDTWVLILWMTRGY